MDWHQDFLVEFSTSSSKKLPSMARRVLRAIVLHELVVRRIFSGFSKSDEEDEWRYRDNIVS